MALRRRERNGVTCPMSGRRLACFAALVFHHVARTLRKTAIRLYSHEARSQRVSLVIVCSDLGPCLSRRRLVPLNRGLRLLHRQAGMLDHPAQSGPVFDCCS